MHEDYRILFAIPPEPFRLVQEIGNEPSVHIGLAYVATCAAAEPGVSVRVLDAPAQGVGVRGFERVLAGYRPDLLAMTAYTFQIQNAARVAAEAKRVLPGLKTVIGGTHVNAIPRRTLDEFPSFDLAVFGEGERTLVELVRSLRAGGTGQGVEGVAYRSGEGACRNPPRPYIDDLTEIPYPDFSLFPMRRYANTVDPPMKVWLRCVPITIHRGCPYRCKFCLRSFGNRVRTRPVEHALGEIERDVADYRANRILIYDETFSVNRAFALRFCEEMRRRGLDRKVRWFCQTRTDLIDVPLLREFARAGCHYVNLGIESGSEEQLRAVAKGADTRGAGRIVREAERLGVRVQCGFIIGLPGETEASARETIRTAVRLDPSVATFSILTPFPGTEIYEMARRGEAGLRLLTEDWSRYGKQAGGGALELENLPLRRLLELQNLAYRSFYLRPGKFLNVFLFVTPFKVLRYLLGYFLRRTGQR